MSRVDRTLRAPDPTESSQALGSLRSNRCPDFRSAWDTAVPLGYLIPVRITPEIAVNLL